MKRIGTGKPEAAGWFQVRYPRLIPFIDYSWKIITDYSSFMFLCLTYQFLQLVLLEHEEILPRPAHVWVYEWSDGIHGGAVHRLVCRHHRDHGRRR